MPWLYEKQDKTAPRWFWFSDTKKRRQKHTRNALGFKYIPPNRAPEGHVLLRSMLGGARAAGLALQDSDRLADTVMHELAKIMDVKAQPDFVKVYIHEKGIPQYVFGPWEES